MTCGDVSDQHVRCRTSAHRMVGLGVMFSVVFLYGCGPGGPETYQVKGSVTLDGKPLPNVIATFMPIGDGRSAEGLSDEQGNFRLSTFVPNDGALAGSYNVAFMPKDPPPMPGAARSSPGGSGEKPKAYTPPFPDRYGMPADSGFQATVEKGGENTFSFDLKSR